MNAAVKLLKRLSDGAERQVNHTYLCHQQWLGSAAGVACGLYLVVSFIAGLLSGWAILWEWLK
jgi:hypothetical protein